jgi:hypothetical protein
LSAFLTHLSRPSQVFAAARSIRSEGPCEYCKASLPGRSFGVAKPARRPRSLILRPGTKFYLLALGVSSRRAANRSPTHHVERGADGIGINSNEVRVNTQAIESTFPDDLCDSGIIDSPSVSGDVPRGRLWRFTEAATDLPRKCAVNFRDLQDLGVFENQAGLFLFHTGLRYSRCFMVKPRL